MNLYADKNKATGEKSPMLFGHFLEHFHRQIYGGVYDPGNPLSDGEGMRTDVIEALKRIKTPIIRWPGGCFVSTYNWKKGVGKNRVSVFDKSWRVEDTNAFGTDEFISLCKKIGCEPYICTNAGTGAIEEMSDWVEYCNLANEGKIHRLDFQTPKRNGCAAARFCPFGRDRGLPVPAGRGTDQRISFFVYFQ